MKKVPAGSLRPLVFIVQLIEKRLGKQICSQNFGNNKVMSGSCTGLESRRRTICCWGVAAIIKNFVDHLEGTSFGRKKLEWQKKNMLQSYFLYDWEVEKDINGTWDLNLLRKKDQSYSHWIRNLRIGVLR